MGRNIKIFAGAIDDRTLVEYAVAEGLYLFPLNLDKLSESLRDPCSYPACYLSLLPVEKLHPHGEPPRLSEFDDPLIKWTRSYYEPPYLVAGRLYWSDDVPELAAKTKTYFSKLARWMKKLWRKREEDGYFIGPDAERLVREDGAKLVYFPPDVKIETINV